MGIPNSRRCCAQRSPNRLSLGDFPADFRLYICISSSFPALPRTNRPVPLPVGDGPGIPAFQYLLRDDDVLLCGDRNPLYSRDRPCLAHLGAIVRADQIVIPFSGQGTSSLATRLRRGVLRTQQSEAHTPPAYEAPGCPLARAQKALLTESHQTLGSNVVPSRGRPAEGA